MENKKWAFIYLIVATLGFVVSGIPYVLGFWYNFLYIPFIGAILAFGFWIYLNKDNLIDFFKAKSTKNGLSNGTAILIGFLVLIGVNFLSVRYDKTYDITKDKLNSLSDESLKVTQEIKEPVVLKAYYQGAQHAAAKVTLKRIFKLYENVNPKVTSQILDAHSDPEAAKYLTGEDQNRLVVLVEQGNRSERIGDPIGEENITTALIRLKSQNLSKIYFTTGHGERSITDETTYGLTTLKTMLENRGFQIANLSLLNAKDGVPDDASAVVVMGPRKPFLPNELSVLKKYELEGGKLLLAIDPDAAVDFSEIFKTWGIKYDKEFVISVESMMPLISVGSTFSPESEVTEKMKNAQVLFPVASSFSILNDNKEYIKLPLVQTSEYSFAAKSPQEVQAAINNIQSTGKMQGKVFNLVLQIKKNKEHHDEDGHDHHGHNHGSAPSLEDVDAQNFSALVVADSDFVANEYINTAYNKDLILNAIVFLSGQKDLITIRPNTAKPTTINLSPTGFNVAALSALFVPFAFLFLSVFFWIRRRSM